MSTGWLTIDDGTAWWLLPAVLAYLAVGVAVALANRSRIEDWHRWFWLATIGRRR